MYAKRVVCPRDVFRLCWPRPCCFVRNGFDQSEVLSMRSSPPLLSLCVCALVMLAPEEVVLRFVARTAAVFLPLGATFEAGLDLWGMGGFFAVLTLSCCLASS